MKQLEVKDALPKGFRLHWYEIQGVLGRGGFGITYLARDTNLDVNVAIKEYFPIEYASREGHTQSLEPTTSDQSNVYKWGLEKFVLEARTLAKFSHKNIVRVSSVFDQNKTAYMVMDLEVGQSLAEVISAGTKFTESQLSSMLVGLMDGLDFVHEKGFIHRDIKPANIILRPDGEPVLLDFGSARGAMKQTTKLTSLVSFGYTPFEQYHASSEQQGAWTDVYALAGTFHHMLLGVKPAEAMARATELMNGRKDPQLPLTQCETLGFSPQLLNTIDVGLAFKVEDRPQSMGAWKAMLLEPSSQPIKKPKKSKNTPRQTDSTVLMTEASHDSRTHNREYEQRRPEKSSAPLILTALAAVIMVATGGGYWWWQGQKNNAPAQLQAKSQAVPKAIPPDIDRSELAKLKAELQQVQKQASDLAADRAEELARLKAEREEAKRLQAEREKAAQLAAQKRKTEQEKQRKLAEQRRIVEQKRQKENAVLEAKLRKEAQVLVTQFVNAFERGDSDRLISDHVLASSKQSFATQLLGAYQSFSLSQASFKLNVSEQTASTVLTITNIRASNGSVVKPASSWRDIPVVVKPVNGQLRLHWQ